MMSAKRKSVDAPFAVYLGQYVKGKRDVHRAGEFIGQVTKVTVVVTDKTGANSPAASWSAEIFEIEPVDREVK